MVIIMNLLYFMFGLQVIRVACLHRQWM